MFFGFFHKFLWCFTRAQKNKFSPPSLCHATSLPAAQRYFRGKFSPSSGIRKFLPPNNRVRIPRRKIFFWYCTRHDFPSAICYAGVFKCRINFFIQDFSARKYLIIKNFLVFASTRMRSKKILTNPPLYFSNIISNFFLMHRFTSQNFLCYTYSQKNPHENLYTDIDMWCFNEFFLYIMRWQWWI